MPPRIPIQRNYVCSHCQRFLQLKFRTRPLSTSHRALAKPSEEIDDYYSLLLSSPLPVSSSPTRPKNAPPTSFTTSSPAPLAPTTANISPSKSPPTDTASRARIVFGTRLAGPTERAARARERDAQASVVAGVRIPPRPAEPDNCCMSGCVNCVWDLYREELEDWAAKRREAEVRAHGEEKGRQGVVGGAMSEGSLSMDDDGGGSETNWDSSGARLPRNEESELFKGVPVGIRQFMATEKRLAENRKRREREAAASS